MDFETDLVASDDGARRAGRGQSNRSRDDKPLFVNVIIVAETKTGLMIVSIIANQNREGDDSLQPALLASTRTPNPTNVQSATAAFQHSNNRKGIRILIEFFRCNIMYARIPPSALANTIRPST